MAISLQDVERQKQALLKKHPELKELHMVSLCDSGLSYQELSDFIEKCWRYDYRDEVRMSFCPEFLEFIIGPLKSNSLSSISLIRDELVGLILAVPIEFVYHAQVVPAYIGTALCTEPNCRGRGISQSLYFVFVKNMFESKGELGFFWLDVRHSGAGSSYSTYGSDPAKVHYERSISFLGKAFQYEKARAIAKLNSFQRLGSRLIARVFPSKIDLPRHLELEIGSSECAKKYGAFIHEFQGDNDIKRYFSDEELVRRITFSQGSVSGAALAASGGG